MSSDRISVWVPSLQNRRRRARSRWGRLGCQVDRLASMSLTGHSRAHTWPRRWPAVIRPAFRPTCSPSARRCTPHWRAHPVRERPAQFAAAITDHYVLLPVNTDLGWAQLTRNFQTGTTSTINTSGTASKSSPPQTHTAPVPAPSRRRSPTGSQTAALRSNSPLHAGAARRRPQDRQLDRAQQHRTMNLTTPLDVGQQTPGDGAVRDRTAPSCHIS